MAFSKFAAVALLMLCLSQYVAQAVVVSVNWEKRGGLKARGLSGRRSFNKSARTLRVCSNDVVRFAWSGETMNLWMFPDKAAYNSCSKRQLNFLKNPATKGEFYTKPNRAGWRYYGYLPGLDKRNDRGRGARGASCSLKLAVFWGKC